MNRDGYLLLGATRRLGQSMRDRSMAEVDRRYSPVVPFLLGTAVGGIAGGLAGTLLSKHAIHLVALAMSAFDRRLTASERDELRFELLLQ